MLHTAPYDAHETQYYVITIPSPVFTATALEIRHHLHIASIVIQHGLLPSTERLLLVALFDCELKSTLNALPA